MAHPWRSQSPEPVQRSMLQQIVEPGLNSPGTTIAGLLPAIYFVVGDLMAKENLKDADWQQIAMWVTIAAIGWFSKSHNVTSEAAGLK